MAGAPKHIWMGSKSCLGMKWIILNTVVVADDLGIMRKKMEYNASVCRRIDQTSLDKQIEGRRNGNRNSFLLTFTCLAKHGWRLDPESSSLIPKTNSFLLLLWSYSRALAGSDSQTQFLDIDVFDGP